ncbi:MAG: hypothetical protein OXU77_18030 [Gammaproteobacteria bacterium]|nr:hypothetical protein [Gammaproteobacteria bacterium]
MVLPAATLTPLTGLSGHLGGHAHADHGGPHDPDVIVVATRTSGTLTMSREAAEELFGRGQRAGLVRETPEAPGEDGAEMPDFELAALVAEAFDNAVEEVEEKVERMEDCVRKRGLTSKQRTDTSNHQIIFDTETEARYDNGTYRSVYNPFDVRSTSNRYEMAVHENAHHVYHANTGRHSRHHPEDWETIEDNIGFNASRFCRGGG